MAKTKDKIETDPFECGELTEEEWRAVELAAEKQVASEALRERCAALRQCLEDIVVQSEALLEVHAQLIKENENLKVLNRQLGQRCSDLELCLNAEKALQTLRQGKCEPN